MSSRKKGHSSSSWQDQIESTLQRLHRQACSSIVARPPPDQASAAIGRGLAERLLEGIKEKNAKDVANQIVTCICENNTSPSLSHAFFDTLASNPHDVFLEWMPRWILQTEEVCMASDCFQTLSCEITAYAQCCCILEENVVLEAISDTYSRLKLSSSRTIMQREFVRCASSITLLTPLMASSVLNLLSPREEKLLFLQAVWRRGWTLIKSNTNKETIRFLMWMAESLHMFLNGIPNETTESQVMSMEVAYQWLLELADMTAADTVQRPLHDKFTVLLSLVFEKILPHFFVYSCRYAMEPIVESLCATITSSELETPFDRATWFRLGALALSTPIKKDVSCVLTLLGTLSGSRDGFVQGMLYSLACIFTQDDEFKEPIELLLRRAESTGGGEQHYRAETLSSMVQLFHQDDEEESLLKFMTTSLKHGDPSQVSSLEQTCAFLLACSLLHWKAIDKELVYSYLNALLQQFPHLGITLLPILFQSIQTACDDNDGVALLGQLDFLCDAVVKDPSCAQEVWNLVGVKLTQPDSPTSVRAAAIRMYPRLCAGNKKLYRRVVDSLSRLVDSKEPEIRLAVSATIHDLAREDRIRDVSDVIGWVQTYLSDENASVAHFGVQCLHHLVIAQELDFSLVMKVLNKRLCPMSDVDMLLALPQTVLEALVLLLGDGECDDDEDSDEDEVVPTKALQDLIGVSPQVSGAVSTLVLLAKSDSLSPASLSSENDAVSRIRLNICKSLSGYSLYSLGLDDEGVQSATIDDKKSENDGVAVTESGLRYIDLKQIASTEIQSLLPVDAAPESDPTVLLARKIMSLEEESLGSSVWQKRGKTTASKPDRTSAPKAAFSALPSPDLIQEMHHDNPSCSTAVASLLCYSGNSVEDLFDYASDISTGLHDPISHVFNVQGWLRAMSMIWASIVSSNDSSKLEALASVAEEVSGWRDLLENADISYLALATFTMFVPDTLSDPDGGSHVNFSQVVERIRNDVYLAYESHQFASRDLAGLCLGIVGARAVQSRATAFVDESISTLEQSISEHSGQSSFGSSYGAALVAQAAATISDDADGTISSSNTQQLSWINRIASLLVQEVQSLLNVSTPAFVTLVACLKTGKPTPDLLSSISTTGDVEVPEAGEQKATCLLLSLALCARPVGIVSPDLLLCLYKFIEKLPWGIGKGFVLPGAAAQCVSMGVLRQNETDAFVAAHERLAKDFLEEGEAKRFSDVLYSCIAMKTYMPTRGAISEELFKLVNDIIGSEGTSMSDDCYSSLVLSTTVLASTFPCLANGGQMFCSAVNLHPNVNKETVAGVVRILSGACKGLGHPKSASISTQSLGLLASSKIDKSHTAPCSVFGRRPTVSSAASQKSKQNEVSLEMLPSPHGETLLEAIMVCIRNEWELANAKAKSSTASLARLLSCLETMSLPSEFARSFIEPMLATDIQELKPACAKLLVSQVTGRRRAAFDGRDFVKLVNRLALMPSSSFNATLGKGSGPVIFIASLQSFLPKVPSDNVEAVLLSLWKICEVELEAKCSVSCTVAYLESLSTLLETREKKESLRLSPRTYTIIVQVLLQSVFSTMASSGLETLPMMHTVEKAFLDCLSLLEATVLEENQLFVLNGSSDYQSTDLFKSFCIIGLVCRQYFDHEGRVSKELLKVVAWFANQRGSTGDLGAAPLRELAFRIAIATKAVTSETKKDIMSLLFEALHVNGPGPSLELLGMIASTWSNGQECDAESSTVETYFGPADQDSILPPSTMSNVSKLLLNDVPCNFGTYGRSGKLQGLVANSVLRIVKTWSEQGVAQQDLTPLEGILICCRTLEHAKEDDLATLMISRLSMPSE